MQLHRGAILKTDIATGAGIGTGAENIIYIYIYIAHVYNTTERI